MCRKSFRVFSAALMSIMEHCMRGCTALGTICIKAVKSSVKTAIKKVNKAVEAGDKAAATAALIAAEATIDKACTKGVLHKNNASRKVSRLASSINKI